MRWIIFLAAVMLSPSCSKEQGMDLMVKTSLNVNINARAVGSGGGTTKAGIYERGDAPVYVDGVKVKADNLDHEKIADIEKEFLYVVKNGGEKVVLEGVTVGRNNITAEGICANDPVDPKNNVRNQGNMPWIGGSDVNDIAAQYSRNLKNIFPLYANYYSKEPVEINVSETGPNNAVIDMVTKNHRVAIVMESASWRYTLDFTIEGGSEVKTSEITWWGNRYAVVFNDDIANGTKEYRIKMVCRNRRTGEKLTDIERRFTVNSCQNVTKYYRLNNTLPLDEGSASANISWVPLKDDISGEGLL